MNRMESLALANRTRTARASFRHNASRSKVREAVLSPPEWLHRVRIRWLLCACPGIGPAKADAILRRVHVSGSVEVRRLSLAQRQRIAEELT